MARPVSATPVVLDTAALLYWTLDPTALSKRAQRAIAHAAETSGYVVSAISLWEIALKVSRGTLSLGVPVSVFVERLSVIAQLDLKPVDTRIWLHSVSLPWDHRDPADRAIVATADLLGAPLITSDTHMRRYYSKAIW
jgi:PIN domain nuclease of toxin-antitoxin system